MEEKEKVFCGNCKYYEHLRFCPPRCNAEQNKKDSYVRAKSDRKYSPIIKNRNNDCEWYEKKRFKRHWFSFC